MLFLLDVIGENTRYAALDSALYGYEENPAGAMEKPFVRSYPGGLRHADGGKACKALQEGAEPV